MKHIKVSSCRVLTKKIKPEPSPKAKILALDDVISAFPCSNMLSIVFQSKLMSRSVISSEKLTEVIYAMIKHSLQTVISNIHFRAIFSVTET